MSEKTNRLLRTLTTMADAERILTELLETVVKNEGIREPQFIIKDISTGGANYSSTLHLITVKGRDMKDLELFAKVACVGEAIRKAMPIDNAYITERFVYQELIKIYENLQDKNNIRGSDRLKFPKLYAYSDKPLEETVILENLQAQGYTCYGRFKSVTWEYAAAAVGALAKLHALSYAFAEDDPEKFAKVAEERAFIFAGHEEQMEKMLKKSAENSLEMVPEHLKVKLRKFISQHYNIENYKKYYISAKRPVLLHGDYRASNLMHKRKNGKLENLIPVDYQTLQAGGQLVDLMYFIASGTDGEFRRLHYKRLIQHYYDSFTGFLTKLGLDPEVMYPRRHFDEDYTEYLPFGLMLSMFIVPLVLVESENAPTMEGDAKITDMLVKPNEIAQKRFLEVVKNYVDWGVL